MYLTLRNTLCAAAISLAATVAAAQPFELEEIGRFAHSTNFDVGASEIAAFDPETDRLFVVNGEVTGLDVLDISNPENPELLGVLYVGSGEVTSCDVFNNVVAVTASEGDGLPGTISFFNATTLAQLGSTLTIGPTPDQVIFSPNGWKILVAHEGEPDYDAGLDPEGSIGIFTLFGGANTTNVAALTADDMVFATFNAFDGQKDELRAAGVRIYGNPKGGPFGFENVTVSQDLEPEFITIAPGSLRAWVTLQENNALAILNLLTDRITDVVPLGAKDHSIPGQGLDASDKDDAINITTWPVKGLYMSDAIDNYRYLGQTFLVLANEGDDRSGEDERIGDLFEDGLIDGSLFDNPATLFAKENLGRLDVSLASGDTDNDGVLEELFSFGARSFTIRNAAGEIVFDSGDMIEQNIANEIPANFNSDNDDPEFDNKSDAQGPEPEGITVGRVGGRTLCFVGMEDVGGVMIFDVTNPYEVSYQSYLNNRNFDAQHDDGEPDFDLGASGDTGPEGLLFIGADDSPTGVPLLVVSYEVSGTTGIYEITGPICAADLNGDGEVKFSDVLAVRKAFGACDGCPEDLNGNGFVDKTDLIVVLRSLGDCS